MPLSDQESRCAALICQHLDSTRAGDWRVAKSLDDEYPSEPSPDVLLTNDTEDIAVEIKRLTDGEFLDHRRVAEMYLRRSLAPKTGGAFRLRPSRGTVFPFTKETTQHLKDVVPRVASKLAVGQSVGVPVERHAAVKCIDKDSRSFVSCSHSQTGAVVRSLRGNVQGTYYLDDAGQPEHQFVTEDLRAVFRDALREACDDAVPGSPAEFEWEEAWELVKLRETDEGQGAVSIFGVAISDPEVAAVEAVTKAIKAARGAFSAWDCEPMPGVALHAGEAGWVLSREEFERALLVLTPADVYPLDVVFLVDEDGVREFRFD